MPDVVQVLLTFPEHPSSPQALVSLVDITLHRKWKLEQLQSHYKTGWTLLSRTDMMQVTFVLTWHHFYLTIKLNYLSLRIHSLRAFFFRIIMFMQMSIHK